MSDQGAPCGRKHMVGMGVVISLIGKGLHQDLNYFCVVFEVFVFSTRT